MELHHLPLSEISLREVKRSRKSRSGRSSERRSGDYPFQIHKHESDVVTPNMNSLVTWSYTIQCVQLAVIIGYHEDKIPIEELYLSVSLITLTRTSTSHLRGKCKVLYVVEIVFLGV